MPLGPFGHPCFCPLNNVMEPYNWVGSWLSICAYNWRDFISIITGLLNIGFWVILSLPQYRKMLRMKSAAGLSISMLLFWTIADVLGLVGLMLSGETGTLLWLTIFFTVNNSFFCLFYFYYDKIYPRYFKKGGVGHDGYTQMDDDGNAERKGLLSNDDSDSDDDRDCHVVVLNRKRSPAGTIGGNNINNINNVDMPLKPDTLLTDEDLLDTPIVFIGGENSINNNPNTDAADTSGGGGGGGGNGLGAPFVGSHGHSGPFNPTTLSFIICLVAMVTVLPSVDAARIYDAATVAATVMYSVVTGDDSELPPCVPIHLPSAIRRITGFILTVICAFMNSVSRVPQITLNRKRKLTAGLSLSFILFQLAANFFFFISRFIPTTLVFNQHWLETSLPWVISTSFSTLCLIMIWWQVYYYGNGASILPRRSFKYARSWIDKIFFLLPARAKDQPDDGYDEVNEAVQNLDKDPEAFFRVASQLQSRRMYHAIDGLDTVPTKSETAPRSGDLADDLDDLSLSDDDDGYDELLGPTKEDIKAVESSNFLGNPAYAVTTESEALSYAHAAIVSSSSFLRTGSFARTPSNFRSRSLARNKSSLRGHSEF